MLQLSTNGRAALSYLDRGWSVMPLHSAPEMRKRPAIKWTELQTRRLTKAEAGILWTRKPDWGVGLICGAISGLVAVDVDSPEALAVALAKLPPTPMRTITPPSKKNPNGGQHWFYRHPGVEVNNRAKIRFEGHRYALDLRGDGGYVVAPPSLHVEGGTYFAEGDWSGQDLPMFDPMWLFEPSPELPPAPPPRPASLPPIPAGSEAFRRCAAAMRQRSPAVQGQGGDQATFATCCYVLDFGISDDEALQLLRQWNEGNSPPWSDVELAEKLSNANKYRAQQVGHRAATPNPNFESDDQLLASVGGWSSAFTPESYVRGRGPKPPPPPLPPVPPTSAPPAGGPPSGNAPPRPPPPPPEPERLTLFVGGDVRDARDLIITRLLQVKDIYLQAGQLASLTIEDKLQPLSRGALEGMMAEQIEFKKSKNNGDIIPAPIPDWTARMVAALPNVYAAKFRRAETVAKSPFWTAAGRPVLAAGYDAESRTILLNPPRIEPARFGGGGAALQWLYEEVLVDFEFETTAERANYVGGLLVPMVRDMIDGPVPMLLIEGNKQGTGKSKLAKMIQLVHGHSSDAGSLPENEQEVEKYLIGVLVAGDPEHVFDNVKHHVKSAKFEGVLTSDFVSGRLLNFNRVVTVRARTFWIMTSNNARLSLDLARRSARVRLATKMEHPEDRDPDSFRHPNIIRWVRENRVQILSALWRMVETWVTAGRPRPPKTHRRNLGSFEEWSEVIGAIMWHAGEPDWLGNKDAARDAMNVDNDEWPAFLEAWWARYADLPVRSKALYDLCLASELMMGVRRGGTEHSQILFLSNAVKKLRDTPTNGYIIRKTRDHSAKTDAFRLERNRPPTWASSDGDEEIEPVAVNPDLVGFFGEELADA